MLNDLTAEIRFRCPSCQKLYCSDETAFSLNAIEASEFECLDCKKSFFLYKTKTELGLYRTDLTNHVEFSKCPKCDYLKPYKQDECPHCHILESKFNEIKKLENPRLYELEKAWSEVMIHLMDDKKHQIFLDLAQSQMALNFASQKYAELKKSMGYDPLVEKYLKQIEIRLEHMVKNRFDKEREKNLQEVAQKSFNIVERLKSLNGKDAFMFVGLLGMGLLIYNKIRPTFPNLTGLIVSMTLLSFGLWFISTNSKNNNINK